MSTKRFLIGTYEESMGIWELTLDMKCRQVLSSRCLSNTRRNSYLALRHGICYAVSEIPLAEGPAGSLHSFHVTETGLEPVDRLDHLPPLLAHLNLNQAGTTLYTASYGTGEILALEIKNGKFGHILSSTQSVGSSVNPLRQTCAHPHGLWLSRDEKHLFLSDLGTDEVLSWPLEPKGRLVLQEKRSFSIPAGYGPRHMTFDPDENRAYLVTEMAYHILEFAVYGGELTLLRDISLENDIPRNEQGGGAIRLSSNGRWLFASNRSVNHSRIDVLSTDYMTRVVTLTECLFPRDFILSRDEEFLICGNQKENSVSIFRQSNRNWNHFWTVNNIPTPACIIEL